MSITTLLADSLPIRLTEIISHAQAITPVVNITPQNVSCPRCHYSSEWIHSRYRRRASDLPFYAAPDNMVYVAQLGQRTMIETSTIQHHECYISCWSPVGQTKMVGRRTDQ